MIDPTPSEIISRLRAQVEELRQRLFFQGNPQVLSDLEIQGVLVGREIEAEEPEIVITDEQRDRVRAEIQKRLAARSKNPVRREPTMRELLQKQLTAVDSVNGILTMHLCDLCREVGIPVPQNLENFSPRALVQAARGQKKEKYIQEWAWDSELRFNCDKMRDALGVEQFGPFYDSDNHDWRMVALGGNTTSQRVLDIIARSYQPSPTACIRAAMIAFNETDK